MAVPSSGQLRLYADIGVELSVPSTNVSLGSMSDQAGFTAPDAMSDFYGYSSVVAPTVNLQTVVGNSSSTIRTCWIWNDPNSPNVQTFFGSYTGTCANNYACNPKFTDVNAGNSYFQYSGGWNYFNDANGLSGSTTYYSWAWACNAAGEAVSSRGQANTRLAVSFANITYMCVRNGFGPNANVASRGVRYFYQYYNPPTAGFIGYCNCNFSQGSERLVCVTNFPLPTNTKLRMCTKSVNDQDNYARIWFCQSGRCVCRIASVRLDNSKYSTCGSVFSSTSWAHFSANNDNTEHGVASDLCYC